jgi:hypothetical protein
MLNLVGNETDIVVNAACFAANHNDPAGVLGECVVVFGIHLCGLRLCNVLLKPSNFVSPEEDGGGATPDPL